MTTRSMPAIGNSADVPPQGTYARVGPFRLPGPFTPALLGLVAVLVTLSTLTQILSHLLGPTAPGVGLLVQYFYVDREVNVPTWFETVVLFACAQQLWKVASAARASGDRWQWHWRLLSVAFVYLSVDEMTSIHELTIRPLKHHFHTHGFLQFAWVIGALPLVAVFGLVYVRFLVALPRSTRRWFLLAGILYVGAAAGLEMIGGELWTVLGTSHPLYILEATTEECLEKVGSILFLGAVYAFLHRHDVPSQARPDVRPPAPPPARRPLRAESAS